MYPINRVLKCRVEELGLTKKEIAEKMGYKNLSKGISKVHDLVYRDYYSPFFLKQFLEVVPVDEFVLELAVEATESIFALRKKIETERDRTYDYEEAVLIERTVDPYILRRTQKKVSPWAFQNPMNKWMKPKLCPSFLGTIKDLSSAEALALVKEFIKEDFAATGGSVREAGKIVCYYFVRDFRTACQLDTEGNVIRPNVRLVSGEIAEWSRY